jgi:hypothetical protein
VERALLGPPNRTRIISQHISFLGNDTSFREMDYYFDVFCEDRQPRDFTMAMCQLTVTMGMKSDSVLLVDAGCFD